MCTGRVAVSRQRSVALNDRRRASDSKSDATQKLFS
jgi:hypothetical protein